MAGDWLERERKQYQEDTVKWLYERFKLIGKWTEQTEQQTIGQTREFVQNAADWLAEGIGASLHHAIVWMGAIAIISLAAAGLWIGVGGVGCVLVFLHWRRREEQKMLSIRLQTRQRFRHLFYPDPVSLVDRLSETDQGFIRECADDLLFPASTYHGEWRWGYPRKRTLSSDDLYVFETLYEEARGSHDDWQFGADLRPPNPCKCEACTQAPRVKEHIENAVSKLEAAVESSRQTLVKRIGQ